MGKMWKCPKEKIEAFSIPEPNTGCWLWMHGRIRARRKAGEKFKTIAADYGIAVCTAYAITSRRNWAHLP